MKKSLKHLKALKKTKLVLFTSRILPYKLCAVYSTLYHKYPPSQTAGSKVLQKAPTLIGVRNWGIGGISLQHRLSAQRWADGINMLPDDMLIENVFKNLKKFFLIMICGIHYFLTKLKPQNNWVYGKRLVSIRTQYFL